MNIESTLHKIVVAGLYAALLMPFVYISTTIFPFVVGKFVYFQILIEFIAVCYIILAVMNKEYRPRPSLIMWLMIAHLGAWALSSIFGVSPLRSFFGNFERMSGVFNYAHFVVYFIILASVMRSKKSWVAYVATSLLMATGQAIVAMVQYYSATPVLFAQPHGRVWGTLGNYIYLAGYTMTHVFLGFFILPFVKRKEMRFWLWVMIGINAFAFFLAQTRGAYMGMAAGICAALLYAAWMYRSKKSVRNWIIGVFTFLIIVGIWTKTNNTIVYKIPVLRIFKHITLSEGRTRLTAWHIAWEGFLKKPIFGWGADNFYFVYNQFYKPKTLLNSYYETWFDRSHNIFMDELATTGLVGITTYIGLAAALFMGVHRLKKKYGLNNTSIAALYGLLVSYYISNFFVFDNAASFLLFALIAALVATFGEEPDASLTLLNRPRKFPLSLSIVLSVVAMSSVYFFSMKPFILANEILIAESTAQNNLASALVIYKKAYERGGPLSDEILAAVLRVGAEKASTQEEVRKNNQAELKEIYELSKDLQIYRPKDVYTWLTLGQLASMMGTFDARYFEHAESYFKKALEFSPARQQIYYSWVKTKVMYGDIAGALALLDKVAELEPLVPDTYWYKGLIYSDIGKIDEAMEWMLKARYNSPVYKYQWKNINEPIMLAQLLEKKGQYEKIPQVLLEASLMSGHENQDILLILAQNYARIGDLENARIYVLKLLEINPKHEQALGFLRSFMPLRP